MNPIERTNQYTALDIVMIVLRIGYGALFIMSGALKLFDVPAFQETMAKLDLFGPLVNHAVAIVLPLIEVVLGAAIALNIKTKVATQATLFFLSLFTAIIVGKLSEGADFACGCFGSLSKGNVDTGTVLRNAVLLLVGILTVAYVGHEKINSVQREQAKTTRNWLTELARLAWKTTQTMAVLLIITFLAGESVVLSIQNKILKNRLEILIGPENTLLKINAQVPPFVATNADGKRDTISYDERKTLIFIMKSTCGPCKKNIPTWNELAQKLRRRDIRVLGVLLDSADAAKKYLTENQIGFSVVTSPRGDFKTRYGVSATPMTIVVSKGVVQGVWRGLLDSRHQSEILKASS